MKKIVTLINLLVVVLFYSQNLTQSENYIYSRTYLEAVTTDNPNAMQVQSVQYFDGLGRNTQSILIKGSPSGKDIAAPSVYDNSGRQTKSYLPLPVNTQNGSYLSNVNENAVNTYYGVANAYAEVALEKSPLARAEKSATPGTDWQINGNHTRKVQYLSNEAGVVKKFKAVTTWNSGTQINDVSLILAPNDSYTSNGYYNANTLFKLVSIDEEGNETHTYSNESNQSILVRQVNKKDDGSIENLDTYYVYDEFGNLSYIIPPKAAVSATITELLGKLSSLCYQYKYDKYNRQVEKKLPEKGWEYMVYDKSSQLVMSQDANLRALGQWLFIKYDQFGRVVYTGISNNSTARATVQSNINANANLYETRSSSVSFTLNGMPVYYSKVAGPTTVSQLLSVNYYDDYPTGSPTQPSQIQGQVTLTSVPTSVTSNSLTSVRSTKSLPTVSYTKNIENDSWTSSVIWYDRLGRIIGTYGKNHLGGFTKTEALLDFSGNVQESYTYHSRKTATTEITVKDRYEYSTQKLLLKHYQKINTNAEELLSEYAYDDLGRIINKKVGNGIQSIDYSYNIQGWLTGINAANINNLGTKLFATRIKYNSVEGAEIPNNSYPTLPVKPKYNGSIAEVDWKTAYGANEPLRRYGYVYDGTNRLRAGFFQNSTNPYSKEYSEVIEYDLNGNISFLRRTGSAVNGAAEVIDDLKYTYANNGNQLSYIEETGKGNGLSGYPLAAGKGQSIKYDSNGNMKDHLDRQITNISYNVLNLPSSITGSEAQNSFSYVYAADGMKLQMTKNSDVSDYLDNFQYKTTSGTVVTSILANEEGYYDFINNRYVYQYKDHLGNIRISYAKNSLGAVVILEENNYYPFGLKHAGYNTEDISNNSFKYLYNGKELQANGSLDYGWRQYMPDLGRWNGMDQLSESYHSSSPYAYVLNNPLSFIDPDGRLSQGFLTAVWNSSPGGQDTSWGNVGGSFTSSDGVNVGYSGNYLSLNEGGGIGGYIAGIINLPGIQFTGQGNSSTWNQGSNYLFNQFAMYNALSQSASNWNFQSKAGANADLLTGVRNDGGIMMIGGAGDPAGLFDIGGQVISTWEPENQYLAAGAAVIGTVGAVVLRKPGLAKAESNLALGLGDDLFVFAKSKNFDTYRTFSAGFQEDKILNAMGKYDNLHFNVTGFSKYQFSKFDPLKPLSFKNYTNWEMHTIFNNPNLLNKTIFYRKAGSKYEILSNYSPFGY
ncbi:DUF6443 domain-containing protein [Chryseobacterium sp. CT-SW4]|uniref:DUF6443 domain-containing protein n=1 Tax=Chryseobacterium sp. SW-1 TaxID=3157343 RepID=UPI003B02AA8B